VISLFFFNYYFIFDLQKDQANDLPPGVFDCKSPDLNKADDKSLLFDFHLSDGRTHHLKEKIMNVGSTDSDICDGSSKSISGYMDIKGSKYDENGDKVSFCLCLRSFSKNTYLSVAANDILCISTN
jgi:hypothetical protein